MRDVPQAGAAHGSGGPISRQAVRNGTMRPMRRLSEDGRLEGQGMAEYALIISLVAIAAFAALASLGAPTTGLFQRVAAAWP